MSKQPEQPRSRKGASGLAIPAGLLIGIGVGFLVDNIAAGVFLGLGAGFLGMVVIRVMIGEW